MSTRNPEKERRLAEALRANLRKRKAAKAPGREGEVASQEPAAE